MNNGRMASLDERMWEIYREKYLPVVYGAWRKPGHGGASTAMNVLLRRAHAEAKSEFRR